MRKKSLRNALFAAALASVVFACSLPGPRQDAARHSFMLEAAASGDDRRAVASDTCPSLRITTPGSAPGFKTSRMVYIDQPPRLDYFAYHEWVDTPARMLEVLMATRIENAGLFDAVFTGTRDVSAALRLDSELRRLVQIFDRSGSSVRLDVKVNLIDTATRSLVSSRIFNYEESASGENPVEGAAAANRAASRFGDDLIDFLSASTRPLDCSS